MALDFPSSPALNDTYTEAGKTWRWNGSGWQLVTTGTVTNADISATAEIAVNKLADGSARQLLQTDAAGTGVEWTSNVDVPGTLDVTGAAVFDSTVAVTGALTKSGSNVVTVGDTGTVATAMVANDAVTYAKLQNVSATDRLLGRSTAGSGDVEEITCTAAGRALIDDADAAAQRTTLGLGTLATQSATLPSGDLVGTTATQTLTNKTFTDPAIVGAILEDIYTIADGAAFEIDPGNGSVQLITLGANRTPKATNFTAGEAVTLMVDDGTNYALTWTDATFGGSGVVWKTDGGIAPTLNATGYTVIVLWKVSTQVYGVRVGNA